MHLNCYYLKYTTFIVILQVHSQTILKKKLFCFKTVICFVVTRTVRSNYGCQPIQTFRIGVKAQAAYDTQYDEKRGQRNGYKR